ncbi:MAG: short-chain dehydrogenase/reductase [Cyanobacteria bacterium RYN_339]|nr:short-chain dehydrogenase/reductase [Cyanobacteria bacterium RYN_339]
MEGKVVIVTGAGRGIGRATALLLAKAGASVACADRDEAPARELAAEIGPTALGLAIDVADRAQVDAMVAAVLARYGRIDVLINNAGITQDATLAKMTEAQFDRVIDVNLKGVFHCTQAVLPTFLAQGKGKIVSASSVVGLHGNFGQTNYAASKAAVIGMTKTWAKELGPKGITANAVAPGFILTDMTRAIPAKLLEGAAERVPLKRLGTPEDVAQAYLFLASDASDFINGHVLCVDGGMA